MSNQKKTYIILGILLPLLIAVALCIVFFSAPKDTTPKTPAKGITVLDSKGQPMALVKNNNDILETDYWAYLEVVLAEAGETMAQQLGGSPQQALDAMLTDGYTLHTAFDSVAFEAMVQGMEEYKLEYGCAITDLQGNLLAVYSSPTENFATYATSPYSSFKPLSVYAPAMEKDVANWSKVYKDAPYKQIEDDKGQLQDWPVNDSKSYSYESVAVCQAIKASLNTVAVRCLAELGVSESMDFLKENFAIALTEEFYVVEKYGADEVIGNIALGYLETGVTPIEMAGFYQIFANGGSYVAPKTITQITDGNGERVYARKAEAKQVLSPATADVMNKLLQGVVAPGGTGAAARCNNVQVAGKTGTGDDYSDNWFVGVTPGYSLAVWHGASPSNDAAKMFSGVMEALYDQQPKANTQFITHKNLNQVIYCTHSGMAISGACTDIEIGYYPTKDLPVCDACQKNETEVDHNA